MTDPDTVEKALRAIEGRHRQIPRFYTDEDGATHRINDGCSCGGPWPCDAVKAVRAVRMERAEYVDQMIPARARLADSAVLSKLSGEGE